jgi:hypothetical protein
MVEFAYRHPNGNYGVGEAIPGLRASSDLVNCDAGVSHRLGVWKFRDIQLQTSGLVIHSGPLTCFPAEPLRYFIVPCGRHAPFCDQRQRGLAHQITPLRPKKNQAQSRARSAGSVFRVGRGSEGSRGRGKRCNRRCRFFSVPFVPVLRFDAPQVHRRTVQVIPLFAVISLFKPLGTCHTRLSPA